MFKIISVCLKKRVKLKILIITFTSIHTQLHWEHCTFYSKPNMKKILANLLLLYRKWRKRNIRLSKKIAVSAFFFTKSNIYCLNWKMLEDLAFLWMTELTFSCIAMVSENASHLCCMESGTCEQVSQPWTIALHTTIPLHFLVLPFWCHPTSFLLK